VATGQTAWKYNTATILVTRRALPSLKDPAEFRGEKTAGRGYFVPVEVRGALAERPCGTFPFPIY